MVTVTATFADQSWGPDPWCKFDYYQNSTSVLDANGNRANPLLMLRHASWNAGHFQFYRNSANTDLFYFVRWLLGNQGSQETAAQAATSPVARWDVCSFETGQQKHGNAVVTRSRAVYAMDAIRDYQRGICGVKGLYRTYGFDPNKVIVGGESAGGIMGAISQLAPPRLGGGGGGTWIESASESNTFSSQCRGIFNCAGPIDIRNSNNDDPPSGTDYFHFSLIGPFLGTNTTSATEWNAVSSRVKTALSIRAYMERGDLGNYPGMLGLYARRGDGIKPIGDPARPAASPHDSAQLTDLAVSCSTAGAPFSGQTLDVNEFISLGYPNRPSDAWLSIFNPVARWMAGQLASL